MSVEGGREKFLKGKEEIVFIGRSVDGRDISKRGEKEEPWSDPSSIKRRGFLSGEGSTRP